MPGHLGGGVWFGLGGVQKTLLGLGFVQVRGEGGEAGVVVGLAGEARRFGARADSRFAQLRCRVGLYLVRWGLLVLSCFF